MRKKIKEEHEAIKNAHDTVDPLILENEFLRRNIFVNTFLSELFYIGRPTIGESLWFKIEKLAKWIWEKILSNGNFWYRGTLIFFSAVAAFAGLVAAFRGFKTVINFLKSLL